MINDDSLFLATLDDIQRTVEQPDEYELLRSTALLRQLLIDGETLVDRVNRKHKLKLRFDVIDSMTMDNLKAGLSSPPEICSMLDRLCPATNGAKWAERFRVSYDKDNFLSTKVLFVQGEFFTVADIIRHAANVLGGVHTGKPKDLSEETLSKLAKEFAFGGVSANIRHVWPMLKVVLDGLEPLRRLVIEQLQNQKGGDPGGLASPG